MDGSNIWVFFATIITTVLLTIRHSNYDSHGACRVKRNSRIAVLSETLRTRKWVGVFIGGTQDTHLASRSTWLTIQEYGTKYFVLLRPHYRQTFSCSKFAFRMSSQASVQECMDNRGWFSLWPTIAFGAAANLDPRLGAVSFTFHVVRRSSGLD